VWAYLVSFERDYTGIYGQHNMKLKSNFNKTPAVSLYTISLYNTTQI